MFQCVEDRPYGHRVDRPGQCRGDGAAAECGTKFCRGTIGDDLATVHHDGALRELFGLFEIMGREHDRATRAGLFCHRLPEAAARDNVHARRRLIEHEHVGVGQERERKLDALLFAARALADLSLSDGCKPGSLHHFGHPSASAVKARDDVDRLGHGEIAQQPTSLQQCREPARGNRLAGALTEHLDRTFIGVAQPEQHVDRGGLARAVRPEQCDDLTAPHRQIDAGDCSHAALAATESFGEASDLDSRSVLRCPTCRGLCWGAACVHTHSLASGCERVRGPVSRLAHDGCHVRLRAILVLHCLRGVLAE